MARARDGFLSQPECQITSVRPARRADYLIAREQRHRGQGEWFARLVCGHWVLRLRRPKVGSRVVCWSCAKLLERWR
jgi:hypothetical protein